MAKLLEIVARRIPARFWLDPIREVQVLCPMSRGGWARCSRRAHPERPTLSTTGFGDVTLEGAQGRLLSMAVMIVGISLFFRLAQAVFCPGGKVHHPCPRCGLQRHELDAVHCKACGLLLNIPNDED